MVPANCLGQWQQGVEAAHYRQALVNTWGQPLLSILARRSDALTKANCEEGIAMLRILTAALFVSGPACAADLPMSYAPQTQSNLVMPVSRGVSRADRPTVDRCNGAIAEWAAQYNPVSISSMLREPVRSTADGQHTATLLVKIKYLRQGGIEPREATINCTVRADGTVSVVPVG